MSAFPLRARRVLISGLFSSAAACAAPSRPAADRAATRPRPAPIAVEVSLARPWQEPEDPGAVEHPGEVSVDVLGRSGEGDSVIATVGDVTIRKSDVYDRLLESDRRAAELWTDLLVLDAVVAALARQHGITVSRAEVEPLAAEEEQLLRQQHELEVGDRMSFEDFVGRRFGLSLDEYRRFVRADVARLRYRSLVMRYVAMREERVELRFIVHDDPAGLAGLREDVLAGADFGTLARRHSIDGSRDDGGRLGPIGPAFRHPIAAVAFQLEAGEVSAVIPFDDHGRPRQALVYCLRRLPAQDAPFAALRDELIADLERNPVSEFEQRAFVMQYCRPSSALDTRSGGL